MAVVERQVPSSTSPMMVSRHFSWPNKTPIQIQIAQESDLCFLFRFHRFEISSWGRSNKSNLWGFPQLKENEASLDRPTCIKLSRRIHNPPIRQIHQILFLFNFFTHVIPDSGCRRTPSPRLNVPNDGFMPLFVAQQNSHPNRNCPRIRFVPFPFVFIVLESHQGTIKKEQPLRLPRAERELCKCR